MLPEYHAYNVTVIICNDVPCIHVDSLIVKASCVFIPEIFASLHLVLGWDFPLSKGNLAQRKIPP